VTQPVVQIRKLSQCFGSTRAVDQVSFDLSGGVTGLLGPNGAGKTTLLRVLATALSPDQGEVRVLGHDPGTHAGRLAVRGRLGYMPQEPGFYRNFTAFEFVDYVAILKELTNTRGRHDEVRRVLTQVGLDGERHKKIKALSGGMRRRVAMAQALLGDPALLVLDEPTVGLDPGQRLRFRELISVLGEGRTVLLSTHQTEDVSAVCGNVVVLHEGQIRFNGEPSQLPALARSRVWSSAQQPLGALASWRTGTGMYRNLGDPPPGADLVEPTLEDGYLLLLAHRTEVAA
jgi:ABC-2 type transport system ATP-binding protein